jgi:hypothetical protein
MFSHSLSLLQPCRCHLNLVLVARAKYSGTDNLPQVVGKHLQLNFDQMFHVLPNICKMFRIGVGIELAIFLDVLVKMFLPKIGRITGHVPRTTCSVQMVLPTLRRVAQMDEIPGELQDALGDFGFGGVGLLWFHIGVVHFILRLYF